MFTLWQGPGTIQILAEALPKIVPYVLINHREVAFDFCYPFSYTRKHTQIYTTRLLVKGFLF